MGLYLSKRNGRLGLLLLVGFSRYGNLIVYSRVPNRKFENPNPNLTTQSAATGWNTSCTQATNGFNFSQRGMILNYAGNPNAASPPQTKSPRPPASISPELAAAGNFAMTLMRHLIVEGSSSSVDNGGAQTLSYLTLYLPHAIQKTDQKCFATDGALLSDMVARQSMVIEAFQDGPSILFIQAGQNDLVSTDAQAWLVAFSAYLAKFKEAIEASGKSVQLGICTHNPRNDTAFNANRAITDPALRLFPGQGKCDFIVDWAIDPTWDLMLQPQIKLYIQTVPIHRRPARTIWRQSRSRLSEQNPRLDKWSVCRG